MGKTLLQLKDYTPIIKTEEGYLITDPNGVWIKLIEKTLDEKQFVRIAKASLETTEASVYKLLPCPKVMNSGIL